MPSLPLFAPSFCTARDSGTALPRIIEFYAFN